MDLLVIKNYNQVIVEENPKLALSSKEVIPPETDRKSKVKDPEVNKLKVEDSEAIEKIEEELKKMRKNLEMAIEDPKNWLSLELSVVNETHEVESPQRKCKMYPKAPETIFSAISEDNSNIF
ncbi:hypothetical protein O181_072056 [Austropuccinia psidii MF-1]|uniref:Uncharacterized protein n=1 Tax=Austropuccinia psidii MF-1 TaxID=1389203 RepID=A0A9Q3F8G6_9BASI|nr:hypothetical protein [Austropuccinia psidii MF-1]